MKTRERERERGGVGRSEEATKEAEQLSHDATPRSAVGRSESAGQTAALHAVDYDEGGDAAAVATERAKRSVAVIFSNSKSKYIVRFVRRDFIST